MMKGRKAVTY